MIDPKVLEEYAALIRAEREQKRVQERQEALQRAFAAAARRNPPNNQTAVIPLRKKK